MSSHLIGILIARDTQQGVLSCFERREAERERETSFPDEKEKRNQKMTSLRKQCTHFLVYLQNRRALLNDKKDEAEMYRKHICSHVLYPWCSGQNVPV